MTNATLITKLGEIADIARLDGKEAADHLELLCDELRDDEMRVTVDKPKRKSRAQIDAIIDEMYADEIGARKRKRKRKRKPRFLPITI